jgi:hypothetical protein
VNCCRHDVAASGTLLRGSAVFFKLKASPRQLLEGSREYALVLRVPAEWRADYVHVRCQAEGLERAFVSSLDQQVSCGQRDFLVALHLEGDVSARTVAEEFARREAQLRTSAQSGQKQSSSPLNRNGSANSKNWLPKLLYGQATESAELPLQLPRQVERAANDFAAARAQLRSYSGVR